MTALTAAPLSFPRPSPAQDFWPIDPALTFLNHGSYGSVPRPALEFQSELRMRCERDPVRFFKTDLEGLLDGTRTRLAQFLNCRAADLAIMSNATYALCTILNATPLQPGDEILITDHEYQSLLNELERVCARTGAVVVKAHIPFPIRSQEEVAERVLSRITSRTKIGFISHITSGSALVFPVTTIVREFNRRGIDIVVDGAHSPGQIPVDVGALKPTYFVGSGHKWLSGPKGAGFVYVRTDRQPGFRPVALSSRAHKVRPERSLYLRDFDYLGTDDYSAALTLPESIDSLGAYAAGGWPGLMRANHELIMRGREIVASHLAPLGFGELTAPESMVGCMSSLLIPEPAPELLDRPTAYDDALQDALFENHRIVVPIWRIGPDNQRIVRLSAHLYNTVEQYETLGAALAEELAKEQPVRATA